MLGYVIRHVTLDEIEALNAIDLSYTTAYGYEYTKAHTPSGWRFELSRKQHQPLFAAGSTTGIGAKSTSCENGSPKECLGGFLRRKENPEASRGRGRSGSSKFARTSGIDPPGSKASTSTASTGARHRQSAL